MIVGADAFISCMSMKLDHSSGAIIYTCHTVRLLFLSLLFGCSSQTEKNDAPPADTGGMVVVENEEQTPAGLALLFENRDLLTQVMGSCVDAVLVDEVRYVCTDDNGTSIHDERDGTSVALGDFSTLAAAIDADGAVILALDGVLYTLNDDGIVPIETAISTPITRLERQGDDLWLWGAGKLYRWSAGYFTEISLPDYATIYDFAVADSRLFLSVPWLIELDREADPIAVRSVGDVSVDSMRVDSEDQLWFVSGGQLFLQRLNEPLRTLVLPEPVVSVLGPTIWVQGEEGLYRYRSARFSRHLLEPHGAFGVDDYGRLLQVLDGEFYRHSIDRPVVVSGLSSSLMVRETIQILPSDPDSVSGMQVWLDARQVEVTSEPWTVEVDPEVLADGEHTLRFFMESDLGDQLDTSPVWVGELPEVVWSEIEALSDTHCLACHGGATLTDLSTKDGWEQRIDLVIEQVSSNKMPLGGPYLSDDEIALIRGWKQGGFE